MDVLALRVRETNALHAALLKTGSEREVRQAYIAALEAERDLLLDCGGEADAAAAQELAYQIEDERAALTGAP